MVATLRALTPIFGRNNRPTRRAVRAIVDKFETEFTLLNIPVPKRRRVVRSKEIIAAVSASIQNETNQSIPRRSQELGIAQTTLWRIMRKDLGLHAFKIKLTQELKPLDHLKRRNFSNWALAKLEENEAFIEISSSAMKLISGSMPESNFLPSLCPRYTFYFKNRVLGECRANIMSPKLSKK